MNKIEALQIKIAPVEYLSLEVRNRRYMWSHERIKRYKTNFAGLIKMLQKRELLLVKRSSSVSPHIVVNTKQNYYDIKMDKNQKILN